jgi:hypothetical protein
MFTYEITNFGFSGNEVTESVSDGRISWAKDKVRFLSEDLECTLQQIENYDAILKEIINREGSAVTATLAVRSISNRKLDDRETDNFADGICELLSLANKNTVYWLRRRKSISAGQEYPEIMRGRLSIKLRSYLNGWSLIPDFVALPDKGGRAELGYFLGSVSSRYVQRLRTEKLGLVIAWIIDAEHQSTIDMAYLAAFIAIELLRVNFLKRASLPSVIHGNWARMLRDGLADKLLATIEAETGTLGDFQKRASSAESVG